MILYLKLTVVSGVYIAVIATCLFMVIYKQMLEPVPLLRVLIVTLQSMIGQCGILMTIVWPYSYYFKLCLTPYVWLSTYVAIACVLRHPSAHITCLPILVLALSIKMILYHALHIPLL